MQKITPFLWFDNQLEQAANFYVSIFKNSKIHSITYLNPEVQAGDFSLDGVDFQGMNAKPSAKINPSISFMVSCLSVEEADEYWGKLSENANVLMEYGKYDFAEKYGWLEDKFGVSWQISVGETKQKISPCLLFVKENFGRAEEAINLYTSLFQNSSIGLLSRYPDSDTANAGKLNYGSFTLEGQEFIVMDSSMDHQFNFSEGISLYVDCKDQQEVDYLWENLIKDGGEESQCGWLKDKFGISWQIIPRRLIELSNDKDPEKARRVGECMLGQKKIIIEELEKAYRGE